MEFKKGDRVRVTRVMGDDTDRYKLFVGYTTEIVEIQHTPRSFPYYIHTPSGDTRYMGEEQLELIDENIKPKKTLMTKLNTMMKKLLDADTQTLVKAGYINGDLELTSAGRDALNTIVFQANKAALVAMAQEALEEEKVAN
jgi:hypothetical protein